MFDYQVVKRIAYTQWAPEFEGSENDEDIISYCARVSNPTNQNNFNTSEKLLKYCVRKKHWSIFEMSNIVLEINTTRDIARQILRHRSFHFQEFSQRYADPTDLGSVNREFRFQDKSNRQNSIDIDAKNPHDNVISQQWQLLQNDVLKVVNDAYVWAIQQGIAKEQARAVLPEGLTMSRMYMSGTCRDFLHYCFLRMGEETQKEHRDVATKCFEHLVNTYPFLKDIEVKQE